MFEWKIGPATILTLLQIVGLIGGGFFLYGQLVTKNENTEKSVSELKTIGTTLATTQAQQGERIAASETALKIIVPSIQRIEAALTSFPIKP